MLLKSLQDFNKPVFLALLYVRATKSKILKTYCSLKYSILSLLACKSHQIEYFTSIAKGEGFLKKITCFMVLHIQIKASFVSDCFPFLSDCFPFVSQRETIRNNQGLCCSNLRKYQEKHASALRLIVPLRGTMLLKYSILCYAFFLVFCLEVLTSSLKTQIFIPRRP